MADTPEPSSGDGRPADGNAPEEPTHIHVSDEDRERVRVQRPGRPDVEGTEIVRGRKAGSQFARRVREGERKFERGEDEGTFKATRRATAPGTRGGRFFERARRVLFGAPIASEEHDEQRLPKWKALAVFSSDALSSSAYATDEILLALTVAGAAALTYSIEISIAIAVLLAIVTFSYRQTIKAYPSGGGAYIVARENLGDTAGLTAAAALSVDYILTVSVSIAAGVLAITSAFPELGAARIELAVGFVAAITLLNLRGLKESGTIFALPTYGFIFAMVALLVVGFARLAIDPSLTAEVPESVVEPNALGAITIFILLRAFASGCAALTGVEAISNGIPAFQKPESRNASTTLLWMAGILGVLFLGITVLAHAMDVQHAEDISAPAQIAQTVFGEHNPMFYIIQAFTALILILAANTSYADFPRLGSILAKDRFLPHQFQFRGDRLAFSNGILVLGVASSALLIVFDADVNNLIPLYAFGVFVSFTLSQSGMVMHWLRLKEAGWHTSLTINLVGAVTTGVVAAIVGGTKFSSGAWLSMLAMFVLAIAFWSIFRHYRGVERQLAVADSTVLWFPPEMKQGQAVLVPVDEINTAVLRTVDYARSISKNVTALHVTDDMEHAQALRSDWNGRVMDIDMVLINSPYRSFVQPVISYIDALDKVDPGQYVTVVLPEFRTRFPWQRFLHNQSARRLKNALLERPNTVIVEVPIHLGHPNQTPEQVA